MEMNFLSALKRARRGDRLAQLLNLTKEGFGQLSHSGIKRVDDIHGNPLYYYIQVSPPNPGTILSKIKMDRRRMVYFSPDEFEGNSQAFQSRSALKAIG